MATNQQPISASNVDSKVLATNPTRRALYIRNYAGSAQSIWVKFGGVATAGAAGELEVIPGGEYNFGGPLPPGVRNLPSGFFLPNCPTEEIHVITSTGTATGCVMEQ